MLPSSSPQLPAFDPVTVRAKFQERRIAAQRTKAGTNMTGRVRTPVGSTRRAQAAEAQLSNEQRNAAEEWRRRTNFGPKNPTPTFAIPEQIPQTPEADDDDDDDEVPVNAQPWTSSQYDSFQQSLVAEARLADSQERIAGIKARNAAYNAALAQKEQESASGQKPIIDTNAISSYTLSFLSFIGMPGLDVGASYLTGSSGTAYKLIMSGAKYLGFEFPEKIEKVPFMPKSPGPGEVSGPVKVAIYFFILGWIPIVISLICAVLYFLINGGV